MTTVSCAWCGRQAETRKFPSGLFALPEGGWSGAVDDAVCPNCQYVEWHPHCTSLIDADGARVAIEAIPAEEWDAKLVVRCGCVDLTISWIGDEDCPESWRCPQCGGTEFEGVHRDYA